MSSFSPLVEPRLHYKNSALATPADCFLQLQYVMTLYHVIQMSVSQDSDETV